MNIIGDITGWTVQWQSYKRRGWDGLDIYEGGIGVHVYMEKVLGVKLPVGEREERDREGV